MKMISKIKGLIITGLVVAPMMMTTVASHADSSNELHNDYKATVMTRLGLEATGTTTAVKDNRITDSARSEAAEKIETAKTDADLTAIYREAVANSLHHIQEQAQAPVNHVVSGYVDTKGGHNPIVAPEVGIHVVNGYVDSFGGRNAASVPTQGTYVVNGYVDSFGGFAPSTQATVTAK